MRKTYLKKRKMLTEEELEIRSDSILNMIKKEFDISKAQFAHIFLPIEKFREVNTYPIIDYLKEQGKKVVLSKSDLKNNNMQHFLVNDNTKLVKNAWGIVEPIGGRKVSEDQLDMVFVPLLVFDKRGNRIGYGKGYYDKFLLKCKQDCKKIGLSMFAPVELISEMEPMDVPLDYCISPSAVFKFN